MRSSISRFAESSLREGLERCAQLYGELGDLGREQLQSMSTSDLRTVGRFLKGRAP